jgi:hypothetical protein
MSDLAKIEETSPSSDSGNLHFNRHLWVVGLWCAAILIVVIGELLPGRSPLLRWVGSFGVNDKIEHFTAYLVLAAIPALGFEPRSGVFAALSMIALGVLLDEAQKFIPGRSFEFADIAANAVGVLTGLGIAWMTRSLLAPSRSSGRG